MDIYWLTVIAIIIPTIATLASAFIGVLFKEYIDRARANPKTKQVEQQSTQRNVFIRWLLLIFPPDERLILLAVDIIITFLLVILVKSSEPITRTQVFYIAALVAAFAVTFLMDTFITVFKIMIAMNERLIETSKIVNALTQTVESEKALPPPEAQTLTPKKSVPKQASRTRKQA